MWVPSGNKCAICRQTLVIEASTESEQSLVGEECHIVSGRRKGPRADPAFPADRIDSVDNLLLLCNIHHKMVDDQPETYTSDTLLRIKVDHFACEYRIQGNGQHGSASIGGGRSPRCLRLLGRRTS